MIFPVDRIIGLRIERGKRHRLSLVNAPFSFFFEARFCGEHCVIELIDMTDKIDEIFGQLASLAEGLREPPVITAVLERLKDHTVWLDWPTPSQGTSNGQKNEAGLYVFWLDGGKDEINDFKKVWETQEKPIIKSRPKIIARRFNVWVNNRLENNNAGKTGRIPMYLGKTKSLSSRIEQHISHRADRSTYSLKLKESPDLKQFRIGYSTWRVPSKSIAYIDIAWMLQILESGVRNELKPFIGRQ